MPTYEYNGQIYTNEEDYRKAVEADRFRPSYDPETSLKELQESTQNWVDSEQGKLYLSQFTKPTDPTQVFSGSNIAPYPDNKFGVTFNTDGTVHVTLFTNDPDEIEDAKLAAQEYLEKYYLNLGHTDEEATTQAEQDTNQADKKDTTDYPTVKEETRETKSDLQTFLESLLAQNAIVDSPTPQLDTNMSNKSNLNDIQMIAMKVKSLNPKAAEELWNMSNLPLDQILEIYTFRYDLSLQIQQERSKYYGMGLQNKNKKRLYKKSYRTSYSSQNKKRLY